MPFRNLRRQNNHPQMWSDGIGFLAIGIGFNVWHRAMTGEFSWVGLLTGGIFAALGIYFLWLSIPSRKNEVSANHSSDQDSSAYFPLPKIFVILRVRILLGSAAALAILGYGTWFLSVIASARSLESMRFPATLALILLAFPFALFALNQIKHLVGIKRNGGAFISVDEKKFRFTLFLTYEPGLSEMFRGSSSYRPEEYFWTDVLSLRIRRYEEPRGQNTVTVTTYEIRLLDRVAVVDRLLLLEHEPLLIPLFEKYLGERLVLDDTHISLSRKAI